MEDNGVHSDDREPSRSIRHSVNPDRSKSPHSSRRSPDASSYSRSRESRSSLHHQQQNNRDRSRDRHRHNPSGKTRMSSAQSDDLIPRFREKQSRTLDSEPRSSRHGRTRSRSRSRDRGRHSRSPSLTRRNRSRSKSPHRKRSRRDRSPSRRSRERDFHSTSKRRRHSPDSKKSTSHRKPSDSRSSPDPQNSSNRRPRRDSQARSPPRSARESHRDSRDSRKAHRVERTRRSRSRSPTSDDWKSIPNRRRSALSEAFPSDTSKTTLLSADIREERQTPRHSIPEPSSESSARGISSRSGPDERTTLRHSRLDPNRSRNGRSKSPHYINSAPPSQESRGVQDNYQGTPTGPSSSHTHRSPPFDPPSGPSNKGIRSGFRGGAFSGRGSYHGSFGGQWTSNSSYGQSSFEQRQSNGNENDGTTAMDIDSNVPDERSFERARDDRAQDWTERPRYDAPTGPSVGHSSSLSGSKFSFAFKPSSKSGPAGPKPEISQKFNAFPSRRSVLQRDPENEPPPDAPTQPAALLDRRPPDGPRMTPRMRKVIKKMKRPKPRPTLTPDLVMSDSVFFRKPGNESVVGSGTYGKVFKGLNVYTKDQVALKRIRMEGEKDGFPVTAVREIKLLQSLRHRNIVNLQEVMVEKNDCFMVFEYLSHDLTGLLCHPNFKLGLPQKKHLAKQMFEGLDYLHVRGVLHRDIKAANILVSSDGILKIADFGLARFYAKRHQLEYTNRVITIWYRSPELLLGETKYTAAVDIWSAACVMMEIFGKKPIFPGDGTELSQLDKIYNVLGTPNRQDWPGLVDMPWFELLRPSAKRACTFYEVYRHELTPAAFELMQSMFLYDPTKRPSASEVLAHAYFTAEEPVARQAELTDIGGDWHEFESRALRKENERREREARRAAKNPAGHGVTER